MTELEVIISADLKKYFGLSEDATNVELSEAIQIATANKKDDVVIEMTSQIAELVKMETDKQVTEFTAKLESDYKTIIETMESKVSALELKLSEVKPETNTVDFDTKFNELNASIENLKTEFGNQLNAIKATTKTESVAGDGVVLRKHEGSDVPLPSKGFNTIKM
jgi:Fe2+ transport system protein B